MYKFVRLVLNRYLAASFGKHLLQHVGSENHTGLSQSTVSGLWRQVGLQHKHVPSCQFLHRIDRLQEAICRTSLVQLLPAQRETCQMTRQCFPWHAPTWLHDKGVLPPQRRRETMLYRALH